VPKHPETGAHPKTVANAEKLLQMGDLMDKAIENAEVKVLRHGDLKDTVSEGEL
jgi:hypothetical protein